MNPFTWLRRMARDAVLAGVQEAVEAVAPEGEAPPEALAQLRERATPALPAAEPEPNGKGVRRRG